MGDPNEKTRWLNQRVFRDTRIKRLLYINQFDVEVQSRSRWNERRRTAIAVGEVRRADKLNLATFTDQLDAFGPTFDHLVQTKGDRRATIV